MRNRNNVLVGAPDVKAAGGLTLGDVVTATADVPDDATTELDTSLNHEPAGYISEDGITKTVDRSTEKIKDWNGDTIIIVQSDHSVSLQFTFMEAANGSVLKRVYGDENVAIDEDTGAVTIKETSDELPHFSLNAEIKGSAEKKIRLFAPDAQVVEVGDVTFIRSGVISYQVTVEAFDDADAVKLYQFIEGTAAPVTP